MHISPNMFEIVELMSGDSACRDVVISNACDLRFYKEREEMYTVLLN